MSAAGFCSPCVQLPKYFKAPYPVSQGAGEGADDKGEHVIQRLLILEPDQGQLTH